jgi:peptidoglycan/xylan/chitin deacetylase (PgdA/CDA1 family)
MASVNLHNGEGDSSRRDDSNNLRALDLPILMLHNVHPVQPPAASRTMTLSLLRFVEQLDVLRASGFQTITFAELFRAMVGEATLPARPVILTFDDGYASFHEFVLPELVERKMTATVFVVAGEIGGVNRWDVDADTIAVPLLDTPHLRDLAAAGIEIGSHGWAHRSLTQCSESEALEEIFQSKRKLRDAVGIDPWFYCYAYGDYAPRHFAMLREAGYRGGVAFTTPYPQATSEPFAMRRIAIYNTDTPLRFRLKLSPLYGRYMVYRGRSALNRLH